MPQKQGKIIIPPNVNIWPHELETAKALAKYGHKVEFMKKQEGFKVHSADALIDGVLWEFKSPEGSHLKVIEKNLRRGSKQSNFIVFDIRRMKRLPDSAVQREILAKLPYIKTIKQVKFINRCRQIIDIYNDV